MSETDKAIAAVTIMAEGLESTCGSHSLAAAEIRKVLAEIERLRRIEQAVKLADMEDLTGYGIDYTAGWFDCMEKIQRFSKK